MAAPTVYENVDDEADIHGQLFAGKRFWVAQRVPSRTYYVNLIKSNGGEVIPLEKRADYLIADHLMKNSPPGSISYTFIDSSIQHKELQDPENHLAGPALGTAAARVASALNGPRKVGKTAFTKEDDKILYKWVHDKKKTGKLPSGNVIYQALEKENPRHTWHSWRDRYLKKLSTMPPSAFGISDDSNRFDGVEYSVEELTTEGLFTKDDWESVYARVGVFDLLSGEDYQKAWLSWAKSKNRQTTSQWRQYYEKVVRPQWLIDPPSKRTMIKARLDKREESSEVNDGPDKPSSQVYRSSSTAVNETPKYITEAYENGLKKRRNQERSGTPPPPKRWKSPSPELGTHQDPIQVSSTGTDSEDGPKEEPGDMCEEEPEDMCEEEPESRSEEEPEDRSEEEPEDRSEEEPEDRSEEEPENRSEVTSPPQGSERDADDLDPTSPTPRAVRYKTSAFDTQAILSSPSQDASLAALPPERLSSEASQHTTESLEEFSQFNYETAVPQEYFPPNSPASTTSSIGSGDPDPPLAPDEVDEYFEEQRAQGFTDEIIAVALRHTRWRPDLTTEVLEAWEKNEGLPVKRGIWSNGDDEDVENGGRAALARLERLHTMDGWGGITERLNFLARYRVARLS